MTDKTVQELAAERKAKRLNNKTSSKRKPRTTKVLPTSVAAPLDEDKAIENTVWVDQVVNVDLISPEVFADEILTNYPKQVEEFLEDNGVVSPTTCLEEAVGVLQLEPLPTPPDITDAAATSSQEVIETPTTGTVTLVSTDITSIISDYLKLLAVGGSLKSGELPQVRKVPYKINVGVPKVSKTDIALVDLDKTMHKVFVSCPDVQKFFEILGLLTTKATQICPKTVVRTMPGFQITLLVEEKVEILPFVRYLGVYEG